MLNRAGSTKNIVLRRQGGQKRDIVRQLTPEEIAELQARLSSDPARVSTRPLRPYDGRTGARFDPIPPLPSPPQKPSTSSTRTTAARLTSAS